MSKPTEFVIHFDGAALPPEAEQKIAHALQAATLAELARLDITGGTGVAFHIPRKEWLGMWLSRVPTPVPVLPGRAGSNPMPGSPAR